MGPLGPAGWAPGPAPGPLGPLATARAPAVITRSVPGLGGVAVPPGRPGSLPAVADRPYKAPMYTAVLYIVSGMYCRLLQPTLRSYLVCPGGIAVSFHPNYEVAYCVRVVLPFVATHVTKLAVVLGWYCRLLPPTLRSYMLFGWCCRLLPPTLRSYILCPGCAAVSCNPNYEVIYSVRVVLPFAADHIAKLSVVSRWQCR